MFDGFPREWSTSTVGEVVDILDSQRIPLNSEERRIRKGPYPYWGANGIVDYIDAYLFDEPLVLMAEDGGYFSDASTKPICHRLDGPAWVNNHAHVLRPTKVDRDFFYYYFVHRDITPFIKGGTRTKLNQSDLRKLPVTLPSLVEQRRIAEVLRSVDDALSASAAMMGALLATKAALVEKFLEKSSNFEEVRLGDIIKMMDSGWSPDCEQRPAIAGSWSVLKTSSITWDGYDDSENKALPEGLSPRPQLEVQPGDILVTRAGQAYRTGVVAMVDSTDGKRMISDKLVRIRVDPAQITPILASEILKSDGVQSQLNPLKSGLTTLTNVTQKMIADLTFLLAPLADQSTFTNYLLAADTSIKSCRMQAMSLRRLKPYIVSDLLSGRVRVPA